MSIFATSGTGQTFPVNGFVGENHIRDMQFKLVHNLQSTLDLNATLDLFYANVKEAVTISGMDFELPNTAITKYFGEREQHSARYNLKTEQENVGVLTFTRSKKFLEAELALLEVLSSVLFYPLRNALLYKNALESSMRDTLTGFGNRAALDAAFNREIKLATRHNTPMSLVVIDIDHFKMFNDEFGHRVGDKALKHVANVIHETLRETDQIFRFGGEEFVAILNNTGVEQAKLVAERIRMQCAMSPFGHGKAESHITLSIGISTLNKEDTTDTLFERADQALYDAKNAGRNKVIFKAQ